MDPINQKERTTSFFQFMMLFTVTVIFAILCTFFGQQFFKKDYEDLRKELHDLKKSDGTSSTLVPLLDTIQINIQNLDVKNSEDFDVLVSDIRYELLDQLKPNGSDSTDADILKSKMRIIFNEWINDKKKLLKINKLETDIVKKDKSIDRLNEILIQKGVSEDVLKQISKD